MNKRYFDLKPLNNRILFYLKFIISQIHPIMSYTLRTRSKRVKYVDPLEEDEEIESSKIESSKIESSDEDEYSPESDDSTQSNVYTQKRKKTVPKKKDILNEELSEYEKIREKNISDRMMFLSHVFPDTQKPVPRKRKAKSNSSPVHELRVRLQRISPNIIKKFTGQEPPLIKPLTPFVDDSSKKADSEKTPLPKGPVAMSKVYKGSSFDCGNIIDVLRRANMEQDFDYSMLSQVNTERLSENFKKMTVKSEYSHKILSKRIYAIAVHPSSSTQIVSIGGTLGDLSIWNLSTNKLHLFEPHERPVSCLKYNPDHIEQLITSSYDGTIRCTDLNKEVFNEIYRNQDDKYRNWISSFDSSSSSSLIASLGNGNIAMVDFRSPSENFTEYQLDNMALRTVSIHPLKKEYIVISSNDGLASIYDIRKIKDKSHSISKMHHEKAVNSGFFSPSGNSILTTSIDNHLRIFDSSSITENLPLLKKLRHDTQVSHSIAGLRAVWLPERDDSFIVGNIYPRQIQIYSAPQGELLYAFTNQNLRSISLVNVFHNNLSFLVGGDLDGQMFIFM